MTVGEMPVHTHSAWADAQGNHNHSITPKTGRDSSSNISASYSNSYNAGTAYTEYNGNHSHNIGIGNTGSSQSHNIMQPYLAIYIWKRIA